MIDIIQGLVSQYPVLANIVMVMGVLRVINKPLFAVILAYVEATPSISDNEMLKRIQESVIYKYISIVLDFFGSIKLPQAKQ